jgi:hypothetical protein
MNVPVPMASTSAAMTKMVMRRRVPDFDAPEFEG